MLRSLPQLEAYYWVARLGSFRAAAERLGLTQPSISIRIRELETDAGGALFARSSRGVRMTDKGRAMFDYVERVITLLNDLNGHLRDSGPLRGLLRFGVPDSFALCCLPRSLAALERLHPDLHVAVTVDNSRILAQRLEEGLLDVAILAQPETNRWLRFEALGQQSISWVASPAIELPARSLSPDDIKQLSILTNPSPSPTHSVLMDWFASHRLIPSKIITCNSIAAIVGVAVSGGGICVVPTCVVQEHLTSGELVELSVDPPLPNQEIAIAFPSGSAARTAPKMVQIIENSIQGTGFVAGRQTDHPVATHARTT
jgi:DNA-binding transcriptional LysR family regulator